MFVPFSSRFFSIIPPSPFSLLLRSIHLTLPSIFVRLSDSYNPSLPAPPPINRSGPSYTSSTSSTSTSLSGPSTSKSLPATLPDPPKPTKAKALRKGKRVLQVEDEFGGTTFAKSTQGQTGSGRKITELKKAFLSSEFYSAFHTQREYLFADRSNEPSDADPFSS